jgi:uncharacterized protein (TIGR03437 family)
MTLRRTIEPLLLTAFAAAAFAQCPITTDAATYPASPLTYPMTSNRYAVQYQLDGSGTWTNAQVYISYYGGTNSSPLVSYSGYSTDTSMSFVSIPANASTAVAIRVTKLWGSNFPAQVSVRPSVKAIPVSSINATTVQLSTSTAADFAGEQFILSWSISSTESSGIQGLGIFLNPPYTRPTGANVKIVAAPADLTGDLSTFDTLDFEGTIAIGGTGAQAFVVPANIANIFLGPGAWVQGKLRFEQGGAGIARQVYGPGVVDVSRFNYMYRACGATSAFAEDGYTSLSWIAAPADSAGNPSPGDRFTFDGIVTSDGNNAATGLVIGGTVNNTKIMSWNGNNGGLELGVDNLVTNVFLRVADDSLMLWGSYITVTNATVWQNYNGGVVNLGWSDNTPGDDCLIDGLYVVKTDWSFSNIPSFTNTILNADNDAVITSLMTPQTSFGTLLTSVYRNIYVEDPPRAFLSLKILPPDCSLNGLVTCPVVSLSQPAVLNLDLENVSTPPSTVDNLIGFQTVSGVTLTGSMSIGLTDVMITGANGTATALTNSNAASLGKIVTNGGPIDLAYASVPVATTPPVANAGGALNDAGFVVGAPVAPGSIAALFGSGFGDSTSGVTVLMGGIVAPLFGVYGTQIDFQVPWQLSQLISSGQPQATLTVTSGDLTSVPITVPLANDAPGIFLVNSANQGAVLVANTASIAAPAGTFPGSRPVQQGEYLSIYCTGLGPVLNAPATGASASDTSSTTNGGTVTVSIGGVNAPVSFSGLAPGYLGLYQVNAQVPQDSPIGPAVSLTVSVGAKHSNQAAIAVAAASP